MVSPTFHIVGRISSKGSAISDCLVVVSIQSGLTRFSSRASAISDCIVVVSIQSGLTRISSRGSAISDCLVVVSIPSGLTRITSRGSAISDCLVVVSIQSGLTRISSKHGFSVVDPATGRVILSTNFTEQSQFPKNVSTLSVKRTIVSRVGNTGYRF